MRTRTQRSVKVKKIVEEDEDAFLLDHLVPKETLTTKYGFDGSDIGPLTKGECECSEPLTRTLYWYPKNQTMCDKLISLLKDSGFEPIYEEFKIPYSRSAFTAQD